jgi:hypothetical protein
MPPTTTHVTLQNRSGEKMMRKKLIAFLLVSIVISSIFFISTGKMTTAEECNDCNPISTEPGDADYSQINCECTGVIPTIVASSDEIEPGHSITLHVDSGGLACPPFTWEVDDSSYSITSETNADLENATLIANSGSCGGEYSNSNIAVTVTVTDSCEETDTIVIRNTEGSWVYKGGNYSTGMRGTGAERCGLGAGGTATEYSITTIVGKERWIVTLHSGTFKLTAYYRVNCGLCEDRTAYATWEPAGSLPEPTESVASYYQQFKGYWESSCPDPDSYGSFRDHLKWSYYEWEL